MSAHSFVCFCPKTYDRNPINLEECWIGPNGELRFLNEETFVGCLLKLALGLQSR